MSDSSSWILDVRHRLESPPPRPASGAESRLVVVVPLFVVEASLWSLFTVHRPRGVEAEVRLGVAGAPLAAGEERWAGAARVAQRQLGVDPAKVLRLGDLDAVVGLEGSEILPCVAAIPGPRPSGRRTSAGEPGGALSVPSGCLAAPLAALQSVGERFLEEAGETYPVLRLSPQAPTAGEGAPKAELWGPPAAILANLLLRIGLGD